MLKLSKQILAAAALATATTLGTPALAFDDEFAGDRNPGRMLAYLADELDLSQEQEDEIRRLHTELKDENDTDRARLAELRELMKGQVDNFDAGQAQKYADEIGEIATRLAYSGIRTRADINALLDEEQRAAMQALMEERAERHERWRGKRKDGHGPRPGAAPID